MVLYMLKFLPCLYYVSNCRTHSTLDRKIIFISYRFFCNRCISIFTCLVIEGRTITYEELNSIISPLTKKYPDVSIDKEISKADQARIYNDFPNIRSVEQIREKSHIILAYYEALLKEEAVPAVVAYKKNKVKSGLRTSGIGDPLGVLYPYEETVIMNNPRLVPGYTSATILAKLMGDRYGSSNVGQKGDALRHGAWNCLIIRNSIILGASRDNATEYAQKGTTAHEITCSSCYIYDHDVAMDLFNNISARSWMRSEIG